MASAAARDSNTTMAPVPGPHYSLTGLRLIEMSADSKTFAMDALRDIAVSQSSGSPCVACSAKRLLDPLYAEAVQNAKLAEFVTFMQQLYHAAKEPEMRSVFADYWSRAHMARS